MAKIPDKYFVKAVGSGDNPQFEVVDSDTHIAVDGGKRHPYKYSASKRCKDLNAKFRESERQKQKKNK